MRIEPERPVHRSANRALHAAAFPTEAEAELVDRLRADDALALSLVAVTDGLVIGHVAFSPMQAPFRALGLAPVAVRETHRRAGVAATLVATGLDQAAAGGWQGVFVVGEPGYYGRFGFSAPAAAAYASPYAGPYFMLRTLAPGTDLPGVGTVAYAAAFASLE